MPVIINGTTGISGPDGSVSSPAVEGSDADTGFFFTAGKIGASLNGVEANVPLVSGTAQNSTSGTFIDFTGIPSWVKRITVMFDGVSTNGSSTVLLQLGDSGGIENTGYVSTGVLNTNTTIGATSSTAGFIVYQNNASYALRGNAYITRLNANTWTFTANGLLNTTDSVFSAGSKTLSDTLDRIRVTTTNGTDTFDAGTINIMYE